MSDVWLDPPAVKRLCFTLVAVQLLVALANLAYIPSEKREFEAWQSHLEAPVAAATPAPAPPTPVAPVPYSFQHEFVHNLKQQLDLDRECNFTTWLSSMQSILLAFVTLMLMFQSGRREWLLLIGGFAWLSMDELCQIHEWVGFQLSNSGFHLGALGPPYPWVIILGPIFLLYGFGALRFMIRELAAEPRLKMWALAALLMMASSLPLEVIGGELQGEAPRPPRLEVIAEETLETLGGTTFLYVLLTLLIRRSRRAAP